MKNYFIAKYLTFQPFYKIIKWWRTLSSFKVECQVKSAYWRIPSCTRNSRCYRDRKLCGRIYLSSFFLVKTSLHCDSINTTSWWMTLFTYFFCNKPRWNLFFTSLCFIRIHNRKRTLECWNLLFNIYSNYLFAKSDMKNTLVCNIYIYKYTRKLF